MIRPAVTGDADWIATLWNEMIKDTLFTFTTEPKSQDAVAEMIATRPVLVLPDEAGFATYGPFRSVPGYAATVEHTIILDPAAHGQGQGRALLNALMEHARAAGNHVTVAAISGANPDAVAFHATLGFDHVGHMREVGQKAGRWLDMILMQKLL